MTNQALRKVAVDATAEDYWEHYFGDYGKRWVRKIPRRIATAMLSRTAQTASGREAQTPVRASIVPIMPRPVITEDRVYLEAALDLTTASAKSRRLICAEFDHAGRLLALDSIVAPV